MYEGAIKIFQVILTMSWTKHGFLIMEFVKSPQKYIIRIKFSLCLRDIRIFLCIIISYPTDEKNVMIKQQYNI